ncbi:MAG: type I 3-dehydroquinate dehydratase [Spirochaetaceae bacterium]|jgi:3-dehydroquinate dehydratase/shikimate dehydrogenase|nr:type I 3-dehydroquinate dehydratase [Spirochaetaceae bacterium]
MSKICLVLTAKTIKENLEIIRKNQSLIDLVELRTDLLDEDQYNLLSRFPSLTELPVILTCRKVIDGGRWDKDENLRKNYLLEWMDGAYTYIDLEMDLENDLLLIKKATARNITIIRSFHNFDTVPEDLYEKMSSYTGNRSIIVKGAVYPQSSEELFQLINVSLQLKVRGDMNPFILLGMGEFGFPTRILAEKMGSTLTYCSDSFSNSGAPGHCSASDLKNIYHFKSINDETVINAIIGNPLKQSRSPHIHNQGYLENKINAVYVPFLTDSPRWFMRTADLLHINGSSVTIPFKSEIIPLVDETDKAVEQIGASNTIYRDDKGNWKATNTDFYGLIKPLMDFLGIEDFTGYKVAVIGAGGAARAAVFALTEKGAEVAVFNRTMKKGKALAELFHCKAYPLDEFSIEHLKEYRSIIIQTTNAGMSPLEDVNPLSFYPFSGDEVVYDIIYKPEVTKLMQKAADCGCRTLSGYKMLEEQAYLQFELFTGKKYH